MLMLDKRNRELDALMPALMEHVRAIQAEREQADWWRNGPPGSEP